MVTAVLSPVPAAPVAVREAITWQKCPEDETVDCGSISVPADWSRPAGPKITLALARRPATDKKARIGTLMVNPGGPGGSAIDFTLNAPTFFTPDLRRHFDIVGLDPRGVGRSAPVLCSQDLIDAVPSPIITSPAAYDATIAFNRKLAADCAKHSGPAFQHADTLSVVRDTDAVRAALGESKISYYGSSYGSMIGELYSQYYPAHLRALVLDSVMDHSADIDDFLTRETDAAQDSFEQFIAWCARDKRCILRGRDIPRIWAGLLDRARAGTLEDPYDRPHKLGLSDLLGAAFAAFYDPQWYSFAYYLRDADEQKSSPSGKSSGDIGAHSFPAVFCADWRLPITGFADYQARLKALAARDPLILASPLAITATAGCLGWPLPPANPQTDLNPVSMPVLLVNAIHDPATAFPWSVHVAAQLGPKAVLLRYRGWGHVSYDKAKCVSGLVDRYLDTLWTPPAGTSCIGVEPEPYGVG